MRPLSVAVFRSKVPPVCHRCSLWRPQARLLAALLSLRGKNAVRLWPRLLRRPPPDPLLPPRPPSPACPPCHFALPGPWRGGGGKSKVKSEKWNFTLLCLPGPGRGAKHREQSKVFQATLGGRSKGWISYSSLSCACCGASTSLLGGSSSSVNSSMSSTRSSSGSAGPSSSAGGVCLLSVFL